MKKGSIIVAVGPKQGGKSKLQKEYIEQGYIAKDFKDDLCQMAWDILGYVPKDYEKFKLCVLGLDEYPVELSISLKKIIPTLVIGREFLQRIGTEAIRKRDEDFWARSLLNSAISIYNEIGNLQLVNADCRFPNEIRTLLQLAANGFDIKFIFCAYNDLPDPIDMHDSEILGLHMYLLGRYKHRQEIPMIIMERLSKATIEELKKEVIEHFEICKICKTRKE